MEERDDLSEWVIHFIHDRNLENEPEWENDDFIKVPLMFNENGRPLFADLDFSEQEYPIEPDASAYQVLEKILFDGVIRSGWSFRNGKATIYGPFSAVCFTEMPLYALISYVKERNNRTLVNTFGIALLKNELFKVGGRPVIYGLSGPHIEASINDDYYGRGLRCLSSKCGIGLNEQYRYVSMSLDKEKWINWTHEREWRWPYFGENLHVPGLPIWLEGSQFSAVLVIVEKKEEVKRFLDKMKEYNDSGSNNYCSEFDRNVLANTYVFSIEEIDNSIISNGKVRIEDLPLRRLLKIDPPKVSENILDGVKKAVYEAHIAASHAAEEYIKAAHRNKDGDIMDVFGFAHVKTWESHSEITQALLDLGFAKPIGGLGYTIYEVTKGINTASILGVEEAAAKAAADKLSELLGQSFYVDSRLD